MRRIEETDAIFEKNIKDLKEVYDRFAISPKYVVKHRLREDCIYLYFGSCEAIESISVVVDRHGYVCVTLGCWCACTQAARISIEKKRFDSVHEALEHALETANKINTFFKQF